MNRGPAGAIELSNRVASDGRADRTTDAGITRTAIASGIAPVVPDTPELGIRSWES